MANNYTLFCVEIDLPTDEHKKWIREQYDDYGKFERISECHYDPDSLDPEFAMDIEGGTAYIYSEECGNVDKAAEFISAYMKHFAIKEPIVFGWANTCSKPRPGEFGGGAVAIGADHMAWMSSPEAYVEEEYRKQCVVAKHAHLLS